MKGLVEQSPHASQSSSCPSPYRGGAEQEPFVDGSPRASRPIFRASGRLHRWAQHRVHLQGQATRREDDRPRVERPLCARGQRPARLEPHARQCATHRRRNRQSFLGRAFDKPLADLFDMQDQIVARLASALNAHLIAAEARRAEQAPTPESHGPLFSGSGSGQ